MGKGGTKFYGEAIGQRSKRPKTFYTGKEMRANMEEYIQTGRHAELENAAQERRETAPGLPLYDMNRQHVFIDISIANKPAGRIVVELFDDIAPAATAHLRNRCQPGAMDCLVGTEFHKVMPYNAIFGGRSNKGREPMHVPQNAKLTTQEAGCLLVSLDGLEIAISLDRAMNLDETHQVVGRIHMGREMLDKLNNVTNTPPDDAPLQRVVVTKCGMTNHLGVHDDSDAAAAEETKEAATAKAREASVNARSAVLEALEVGLQTHKRKAAAAGAAGQGDGGSASAAAAKSGPAAAPPPSARGALDGMLGGSSSSSSSGSEGD